MFKKVAVLALAALFFGPAMLLLAIGVLMNPAAIAACTTTGSLSVGNVPDSLTVTTADGYTFTLNKRQLTHAATIITVGGRIDGVGRPGVKVALMAALTETTLRMLSNTGTYPESANYPNDGNGGDHDSLGLFQMRPQSGWGSVAELMDPTYQARAFFGGTDGPNYPSPRGLLDIPGWERMDPGEAAQSVEVSAFPDRYRNYAPVADAILDALTRTGGRGGPVVGMAESSRVVFPLPEGTWVKTDDFGPRIHPITGQESFHTGLDLGAADGTPILAAADGTVTVAEYSGNYGGLIVIEHTIDGKTVATAYAHMWQTGILVHAGDRVSAGQHIGDVGSSGMSTGAHLHFEVRPGGTNGESGRPRQVAQRPRCREPPRNRDRPSCGMPERHGRRAGPVDGRPGSDGGRSHQLGEDHRSARAPHGPDQSRVPRHGLGLLFTEAGHEIGTSTRAGMRHHLRQRHRPLPDTEPVGSRLEGHQLDERQRRRPRRRVPDLARQNLVPRPQRPGLAALQRRRHARPRQRHRRPLRPPARHSEGRCVMDVFPDFDGLTGIGDLKQVVGALFTFVLIIAVLMQIVSAICWAIAAAHGNYSAAAKGRIGVLVALGAAVLAGGGVAWMNWLIALGQRL